MRKKDLHEKYKWLLNHRNFLNLAPQERIKWELSLLHFESTAREQEKKIKRRIELLRILKYSGKLAKPGITYDDLDLIFGVYHGMTRDEIDKMFKAVSPEWDKFLNEQPRKICIPVMLLYPWPVERNMQKLYDRGYTENQIYKAYHIVREFAKKHFPSHFIKKLKK